MTTVRKIEGYVNSEFRLVVSRQPGGVGIRRLIDVIYENFDYQMDADQPDTSRLDTVQGNNEARTELYTEVPRGSTGVVDDVMRQESVGLVAEPASRTDGEEVWHG